MEVVLVRSRGTQLAAEFITSPRRHIVRMVRPRERWLVSLPYGDACVMAPQQPEGGRKSLLPRVANVETGIRNELERVAIEIASASKDAPDAVEPILQPSSPEDARLPMFEEDQPPAGLQDAPDLRQRGPRLRNG